MTFMGSLHTLVSGYGHAPSSYSFAKERRRDRPKWPAKGINNRDRKYCKQNRRKVVCLRWDLGGGGNGTRKGGGFCVYACLGTYIYFMSNTITPNMCMWKFVFFLLFFPRLSRRRCRELWVSSEPFPRVGKWWII